MAGPAADGERTAEGFDPVGQPDKTRPASGVRPTHAVVVDRRSEATLLGRPKLRRAVWLREELEC
jgi:hypothetical protein